MNRLNLNVKHFMQSPLMKVERGIYFISIALFSMFSALKYFILNLSGKNYCKLCYFLLGKILQLSRHDLIMVAIFL